MNIPTENQTCIIIVASHGGVNLAFLLRKEGWLGKIIIYDSDPELPYHKPPLSKAYLTQNKDESQSILFPRENYEEDNIILALGITVNAINKKENSILLQNGEIQNYDKLVIATGARPFVPSIKGLDQATNVFAMRTASDANNIRKAINSSKTKKVVIIGGGYIGLEIAASLKKLGADVTLLEREERILARVTEPVMSDFFRELHIRNGVNICTQKNVAAIIQENNRNVVLCEDDSKFEADLIVLGVGIRVNTELASAIDLDIQNNGIKVNQNGQTSEKDIYAIGDCTCHFNLHYQMFIRLESVQNAVDQAKVVASTLCGNQVIYDTIPWFWSDQFDIKLQMVGLSQGFNDIIVRKEDTVNTCFSVWYFKNNKLLAVHAVNNAKAYMLGTKMIKSNTKLDKEKLKDITIKITPKSFLV